MRLRLITVVSSLCVVGLGAAGCRSSEDIRTSGARQSGPRFGANNGPRNAGGDGSSTSSAGVEETSGSGGGGGGSGPQTETQYVLAPMGVSVTGTISYPVVDQADFEPLDPKSPCVSNYGQNAQCWGLSTGLGTQSSDSSSEVTVSAVQSRSTSRPVCRIVRNTSSGASRVLCAGSASRGSLILGPSGVSNVNHSVDPNTWYAVSIPGNVKQLALGESHACALTSTGAVYCWGANADGQLGVAPSASSLTPVRAQRLGRELIASHLAAAGNLTCAITVSLGILPGTDMPESDGMVYCFGAVVSNLNYRHRFASGLAARQYRGGLGLSDPPLGYVDFRKVAMNESMGCALMNGGRVFCWEALGMSPGVPVLKELFPNLGSAAPRFSSISAANGLMCGLASARLYCWGPSSVVRAIAGSSVPASVTPGPLTSYIPYPVVTMPTLASGATWVSVMVTGAEYNSTSPSGRGVCLMSNDKRVYCYGYNANGTQKAALDAVPVQIDLPRVARFIMQGNFFNFNF